jgi:hypothetical protein
MRRGELAIARHQEHLGDLDTAWKVHSAVADWTGKVDAKASFAFTVESATIATMVALSGDDRIFARLEGFWQNATFYAAGLLFLLAAFAALIVVIPRLRMRKVKKEAPFNFIYFGHLQHWESDQLRWKIENTDLLPVLSRQLVIMSKLCWQKHVLAATSFVLTGCGGFVLLICVLLVRG